MPDMDKAALLSALEAELEEALAVMRKAARAAREAATHEEMKPENDKDTRGLEAGYLAAGQSARARELEEALSGLRGIRARAFSDDDAITALALVELEDTDSGQRSFVFLTPYGGGRTLSLAGRRVQVASARSPLGDALIGKRVGDLAEVSAGGKVRELEVCAVR